jgi:hypothetical protein
MYFTYSKAKSQHILPFSAYMLGKNMLLKNGRIFFKTNKNYKNLQSGIFMKNYKYFKNYDGFLFMLRIVFLWLGRGFWCVKNG